MNAINIKIIPHREDISDIDSDETLIHLAFRPDVKDVLRILELCPKIKGIEVPKSYNNTLSRAIIPLLHMKGVSLLVGEVQGHRRDLNAYYPVPPQVIEMIIEQVRAGKTENEIVLMVKKTHLINSDLTKFIINQYVKLSLIHI